MGKGSTLPSAGERLARNDGYVLSQQRLALLATRPLRASLRIQGEKRHPHVGAGAGEHAERRRSGALMNLARADQIAKAVLYEGYMLYPYRPSSVKNRQRWNFGVVYPQAYSEAQGTEEPCSMRTECLVRGNPATMLAGKVRFLRLQTRSASAALDS